MDAKEHSLVSELHGRINARSFHERDILALLILLRQHAPDGSAVRELSDFVAHREKDRGSLKKYVQHVVAYGEAMQTGKAARVEIDVVFSAADFADSLNTVLRKFALGALEREVTDDVLACVMSLLQDVRLFHQGAEIGRLGLSRVQNDLWLAGAVQMPGPKLVNVVFPTLIVSNRYCSSGDVGRGGVFSGLVEARCTKGKLRLYVGGKAVP